MSELLDKARQGSRLLGETNDCTVITTSIVTDTLYEVAHATLKANGRKNRHGAPRHITHKSIKDLGYSLKRVTDLFVNKAKTVRTFERIAPKHCTFIIHVKGHVLAYKDGRVHDWTKGRCHRITDIFKVTKNV